MLLSNTRLPEAVDIKTTQEGEALLRRLENIPCVALDTETTGLHRNTSLVTDEEGNPLHKAAHVLYWSLSDGINRWCLPRSLLPMFKKWIEDPARTTIMHNASFDTWMLHNSGVELMNSYRWRRRDTIVMHSLLETSDVAEHGLKSIGRHVLGLDTKSFADTFGRSRIYTTEQILEQAGPQVRANYASLDAWMTYTAYQRFSKDLAHQDLWELYQNLEGPMGDVLMRMEYRGTCLDIPYLQSLAPRIEQEKAIVEARFAQEAKEVINLRSTEQLRELFFRKLKRPVLKHTPGGQSGNIKASLDDEVLNVWAQEGDSLSQLLLRYRALDKTLGTYVNGLLTRARPDGRVSTTFTQYVARTGRLTSKEPNLQNVTKGGEFALRKAFIAPPGKELLVFDFGQLELRVAAMLSGDKALTEVFLSGRDLHAATAALMFGAPYEDILTAKNAEHRTPEQEKLLYLRSTAKTLNFGILYGMGAPRLANNLGCEREKAQGYIDRFFRAYPGLRRWFDEIIEDCHRTGYVSTIAGRRRTIRGIHSDHPRTRGEAIREATNTPIQGSAADIVKCVMLAIDRDPVLAEAGVEMLLQVHDEVVMEIPTGRGEGLKEHIREIARDPFGLIREGDTMPVPLEIDIGIGPNWQEAKV